MQNDKLRSTLKQTFFLSKYLVEWTDWASRVLMKNTAFYLSDFYCIPNLIFISSFREGPTKTEFYFISLNLINPQVCLYYCIYSWATEGQLYSTKAACGIFWFRKASWGFGGNHSLRLAQASPQFWPSELDSFQEGMEIWVSFQKLYFMHSTTASYLLNKAKSRSVSGGTGLKHESGRNIWSKRPN